MISIPLRMSKVMKRKLKKWVNRIHNGNPSASFLSITRNRERLILSKLNALVVVYRTCWLQRMVICEQRVSLKIFCRADATNHLSPLMDLRKLLSLRFVEAAPDRAIEHRRFNDSKAKCRMSILRIVIRHCSRCAAKTELCVTIFRSLSSDSLSRFEVFTAYPRTIN